MEFENTLEFARTQDKKDPLAKYREQFYIPMRNGTEAIYFTGNSTGLLPRNVRNAVEQELKDWEELALDAHFNAKNPWYYYHHFLSEPVSRLVGATPDEVVTMNSLTTNLHLAFMSFYQPTKKRYKILIEANTFPSDHYAVESQARLHGFDPKDTIVELAPRAGEFNHRKEDVLQKIKEIGDELALIWIGGVNYYTGQVFDMQSITTAGHDMGAKVGFDLAHGIGNIKLSLHDWKVDFAVWCSYKYLNSGPGAAGGLFIHEDHGNDPELFRLAGWWGYDENTRFDMKKGFSPQPGAAGWQLSNAPVFPMAIQKAALEIIDEVGIEALREKSEKLTGLLYHLLSESVAAHPSINIITPENPEERGCQVSILMDSKGKEVYTELTEAGFWIDWREPNVIRLAPTPLYNSFEEVFNFADTFSKALASRAGAEMS